MSNQKQYFLITDKEIEKMFSSISAAQAYFFAQAQTARNSNESKMFRDLYNGMSEVHDELNPFNRKIINAKSTVEQTRKDLQTSSNKRLISIKLMPN